MKSEQAYMEMLLQDFRERAGSNAGLLVKSVPDLSPGYRVVSNIDYGVLRCLEVVKHDFALRPNGLGNHIRYRNILFYKFVHNKFRIPL